MNKEQFLAISLPHDLKVSFSNKKVVYPVLKYNAGFYIQEYEYKSIIASPILYQLYELTKDEWIEKLNTFACELLDAVHVYDERNVIGLNWMTQPFEVVIWLIENHFDVARLIEKGEAIDVNTLHENPYK